MKERPILMTTENAQKVHEGTKTQTRRIVKYSPILGEPDYWCSKINESDFVRFVGDCRRFCPYGQVGDRLWIREACWIFGSWQKNGKTKAGQQKWKFVQSGRREVVFDRQGGFYPLKRGDAGFGFVRRPSILMPRWACRSVVELTDVRVERLQEISQDDAIAEGCGSHHTTPREEFIKLWESINGKGSWALNPWVWVLTFAKVSA